MIMELTWLGHSAFLLKTSKAQLAFDPFLSGNPMAKTKPEAVKADYVLISHGHGDHLGDGIEIAKRNKATMIAPFELASYCQSKGAEAHPMHIGGAFNFPFGRVKLTPANHGSAVQEGEEVIYTGNPCGFVITADGKNIYFAGDTGLFGDMRLIGEVEALDVALLPIGGNFTMDAADAVRAVEMLKPKLTIPMHYNTWDLIRADAEAFVRDCKAKGFAATTLKVSEPYSL